MTTMIDSPALPATAANRMQTYTLELKFLIPAFMGDAEQSGRWRTPPFKAQLRQWWRVVYAQDAQFKPSVEAMRREEGLLFGHAWLEDDFFTRDGKRIKTSARRSEVRLRLDKWNEGGLRAAHWSAPGTVTHPEVRQAVASDLYLGYGPVVLPRGAQRPTLKANAAIQAGESAVLSVAVPAEHADRIEQAMALMHRYGTVGGRSRNGWGSYSLLPLPPGEGRGEGKVLPLRDWRACLDLDWPHAIGKDEKGPLVWQTQPHADWRALMKTLAIIKIGLRTQFEFPNDRPDGAVHDRHWLSYPVTTHHVNSWRQNNLRLPNQLRFKVREATDGQQLVGVIFHMPHLPPPAFHPNRTAVERVWQQVHAFLDAPTQPLSRIKD